MLAFSRQPTTATQDAEFELHQRLSRLPFYTSEGAGFGAAPWPHPAPYIWSTEAELDLQSRLRRLPFYTPAGLGDIVSDIQNLLQKVQSSGLEQKGTEALQKLNAIIDQAGPHLDTIMQLLQDPALPQVVERLKTLQATTTTSTASTEATPGAPAPSNAAKLLPVLDAAIFVEQHPIAKFTLEHPALVGVGAAVALIGLGAGIGYGVSRWRTKRKTAAPAAFGLRSTRSRTRWNRR